MNIGVLTSNSQRHRFFANHLARSLPVRVVVAEARSASPRDVGQGEEDDLILNQYFDERDQAEREILAGGERFDLRPGVTLLDIQPGKVNDPNLVDQLLAHQVDTLAVFGTSLLKEPLLSTFPRRIVNIHLGVSPYYRGSGTNFWALYNEDLHLVGSTIHYIDAGVDTGEIICHVQAPIVDGDTPHTIGNKVIEESVYAVVRVLHLMDDGPVPAVAQWKAEKGHVYRMRDFNAAILRDLLERWDQGLVRRFLERRANGQIDDVQLVSLPEGLGGPSGL